MDETEQYIKMCEKATEIQEQWEPKGGDYYRHIPSKSIALVPLVHEREECALVNVHKKEYPDNFVFFPRQDQLQEMVLPPWTDKVMSYRITAMLSKFNQWYFYKHAGRFSSMEQLWLGFVMREKYNKVWNGEDWIGQ